MKKLILLPFILLFMGVNAQEVEQATEVEDGIFKINFIPLNFSYEMKVGPTETLLFEPGLGFNSYTDDDNYYWNLNPYLKMYYRYYYNFDKRNLKGKRTARNSVNYLGAMAKYIVYTNWGDPKAARGDYPFMVVGPVWGIQRNYKSHFSLGIAMGPALAIAPSRVYADGILELTLGFHLGGKK